MRHVDLHLLHTNDLHSELPAFARLVTPLRKIREHLRKRGAPVLSFDIGDHIDLSHLLSAATSGLVNVDMLQAAGYDGWVFGNNETLTIAPSHFAALRERTEIPLLCANLEGALENRLYDIDGLMVGVFGVTVYYPKLHDCLGAGLSDPVQAAWRQAAHLRAQGADVVVMLSHLGLAMDQSLADQGLPVDVILGGHSHHFLEHAEKRNTTWLCQAGKYGQAFGHTVLHVDCGAQVRVQSVESELIYVSSTQEADAAVRDVLERGAQWARPWLAEPVAHLTDPLGHALLGESTLVNLLCDELRVQTGADLALINGGVVSGCLRAGVLTRKDLLLNCPTPMRAVISELSGREVMQVVSAAWGEAFSSRVGFGFGFRGHWIGRLHLSGGYVDLCSGADDVDDLEGMQLTISGAPVDLARRYRVAICEFIALSHVRAVLGEFDYAYYPELLRDMYVRALANPCRREDALVARYRVGCSQM